VNRQPEQPDPTPTRRSRPLQAVISLILACAAAVAVNLYGIPLHINTLSGARRAGFDTTMPLLTGHLITLGGSAAFVVLGLLSTFAWARWARAIFTHLISADYGSIIRYVLILIGICIVLVVTLSMLGFRVGQLVLGGTVTAVLVTIAAQQSLSNVFAGLLLQFAHPFKVGDAIWIRSGALGGTLEGVVTEISITYVTLENNDGRILLPNFQVLASAVSPVRSAPRDGLLASHLSSRFGRSVPRPPMAEPPQPPADSPPPSGSRPDSPPPAQNS
jgi:small-conductance mechanosensitive channel